MTDHSAAPSTLDAFVRWLEQAPASTTIGASDLVRILAAFTTDEPTATMHTTATPEPTWRERIWTVPPETRLGVREAAEALGRPISFVYRRTSAKASGSDRLPHRKVDSELTFVAGELRTWLADHEEVIESGRITPSPLTLSNRRAS